MLNSATLPCSWSCQPAMLLGLQPDSGEVRWVKVAGIPSEEINPGKKSCGPMVDGESHASSLIKITASQIADTFPLSW